MDQIGPTTDALSWLFTSISIVLVSLRLFARFRLSDKAGWDDVYLIISIILVVFDCCFVSYAVTQGLGTHIAAFTNPADITNAAKWTVASNSIGIFCFAVPKCAVAVLLARILQVGDRTSNFHRAVLYTPAALMMACAFTCLGIWLGQCQPTAGLWDKSIGAKCLSPNVFFIYSVVYGSFSAATDFFYGIYPVIFISRLNMEMKRKIHLCIMLGLGSVGGAIAIWKTSQLPSVTKADADVTYASAKLSYATLIESNCMIIAACIPSLGPIVRSVRWRITSKGTRYGVPFKSYQQFDKGGLSTPNNEGDAHLLNEGQTRASAKGLGPASSTLELDQFHGMEGGRSIGRQHQDAKFSENSIAATTVIDVETSRI